MKMKIFLIMLTLVFIPIFSFSQGMSSEDKLKRIDREIAELQQQKKNAIITAGAGLAAEVLGYTVFLPWTEYTYDWDTGSSTEEHGNAALFWICVGGGVIAEIYGGWTWWSSAQELSMLKAKRYDISLRPSINPMPGGDINYGFNMQLTFK